MDPITQHHDGHGLNEAITIERDAPDPNAGGASHQYTLFLNNETMGRIQFQHGPRTLPTSTPGVTEGAVLAVLIDRVEAFQAGPYACEENDRVLYGLNIALEATKARATARAARGVLGTNTK